MSERLPRLLRVRAASQMLGISESSLRRLARSDPAFPQSVRVTPRCVGWLEHEIGNYITVQANRRRRR